MVEHGPARFRRSLRAAPAALETDGFSADNLHAEIPAVIRGRLFAGYSPRLCIRPRPHRFSPGGSRAEFLCGPGDRRPGPVEPGAAEPGADEGYPAPGGAPL